MNAQQLLDEALAAERDAYRLLGQDRPAASELARARDAYLGSYRESTPGSWGRLIGALKMAILAGAGAESIAQLAVVETAMPDPSPACCYAGSLAAVVLGQEPSVEPMLEAGGAFRRTGLALGAIAAGDAPTYRSTLEQIVADFASREAHLTGVAIADTALVL